MNNITIDNAENNINFSIKAYDDGYDFSSLSPFEQELTKKLYITYQSIHDFVNAAKVYDYMKDEKNKNLFLLTNKSWSFPKSGLYQGIIINTTKSKKKGTDDYIFEILVNGNDIKYAKLTHDPDNAVLQAILKKYNCPIGMFNPEELIGSFVLLSITNIPTYNGTFSKIKKLIFYPSHYVNTFYKMLDLINEQDEQKVSTE